MYLGLNNIVFTVTLTYYDIYTYTHTIFLGFDGKCLAYMLSSSFRYVNVH